MRGETVNLSSASTWFSRAVCSSNNEAQRETSIAGPCLEHSGGPIVTSAEWASGRGRKASPIAEAWRRAMDKMMSRLIFTSKGLVSEILRDLGCGIWGFPALTARRWHGPALKSGFPAEGQTRVCKGTGSAGLGCSLEGLPPVNYKSSIQYTVLLRPLWQIHLRPLQPFKPVSAE